MKADPQDSPALAPQEESEVLRLIRDDHELIDRLNITPEELEVLSKCALFGTLTCKQDMLFILQQIRAAGRPAAGGPIHQTPLFPQPPPPEDQEQDPVPPDRRHTLVRLGGIAVPEPGSLAGAVRRRVPKQFGVLFWTIVAVVALAGSFLIAMSRWRDNFMTSVGMPAGTAPALAAWYSNLDQSNILLCGELVLVVGVAVVVYLKSHRGSRRLKVRSGRSWR